MSLWRSMCREAAGAVRSICYDLGLLRSRRGRPTRRLVIASGLLVAAAVGGAGAIVTVVSGLPDAAADRSAPVTDGADRDLPNRSGGSSLAGIDRATGSTRVSPSPAGTDPARDPARTFPEENATTNPGTSGPPSASPPATGPPAPTPTTPTTSASPSDSTSPSGSPSASSSAASPPASDSASPTATR